MSGSKLRIGVVEDDINAKRCRLSASFGQCEKPGIEIEIIQIVMTLLGMDYEFVDLSQEYGVLDYGEENEDGTWSGMIGLLINGSIDMSALTVRLTTERADVIDFSFPARFFQPAYIFKRPENLDFRNFIFSPFTAQVWLYLVLCVGVVKAVHFLCVLLLLPETQSWSHRAKYAFTIMMEEHESYPCCSFLLTVYVFATLIMSQYYQSVMSTNLTAPGRIKIPFRTQSQLIDLLEEGSYHLTYVVDTWPPCSTDANCERLEKALLRNPVRVRSTEASYNAELMTGKSVFFASQDIDLLPNPVSRFDENFTIVRDMNTPMDYVGFAFSKNKKVLRQRFNNALVTMLPGVFNIKTGPSYDGKKPAEDESIHVQLVRLTLDQHLTQLFLLWAIAISCVIGFFFIELLWFYHFHTVFLRFVNAHRDIRKIKF